MGTDADRPVKAAVIEAAIETSELDLDAISDADLDILLGGVAAEEEAVVAGNI